MHDEQSRAAVTHHNDHTHGELDALPVSFIKTVLAMDQVCVAAVLQRYIQQFHDMPSPSRAQCLWLFALTARLEKPIHADMGASMRALLRKVCALRAGLQRADDDLAQYNILIAITGAYFGQDEHLTQMIDFDLL